MLPNNITIELPGYHILSLIYESGNSLVYRGYRSQERLPVILKVLKQDYPTPEEITRYKQEYEITSNLNLEGVVRAYDLHKYQNTLVIILEDFGAESLRFFLERQKLDLTEFCQLAIQITESLGKIHQENIIHKDINTANIVINPETQQIKIIDFGICSILSRENPTLKNPNFLEGTLAYMSPEQTGRMNRSLDYRTDFYSLGVTFYEMLTNKLPFEVSDAIELVHCHIAKQPISPHEIKPEIPKAISNIILKLLAKTAEERYQSAWGIKADLEECCQQLQRNGKIEEFPLGSQDISDKFQIPQKLYGREAEINTLLATFERISATENLTNKIEMMLISGYSGIGKSALLREIYKPITRHRGYFIGGKFDQFQRNIPYSGVIKAFQELVSQLLTESATELEAWRHKLTNALGSNAQLIVDVIPEIELIIGPQTPVTELGLTESQNRFNLVFQNFIRVFSHLHRPFVIFLDDLQWADSATLKLLELILTDTDTHSLLLLGAYRDNEVDANHPLIICLESLRKQGSVINQLALFPLQIAQIAELIADTLHADITSVQPLAELVLRKTDGNPFFIDRFLTTLYEENLLTFDFKQKKWQWNIADIEAMGITDNVVELMTGKLKKLPPDTQTVLRLAACVGDRFDLNTISIVSEKSLTETFANLLPAIQEGLILATSELQPTNETDALACQLVIFNYKFLHDRVQQAAYVLIDAEKKQATHLRIGRLLLANTNPAQRLEKIFDLADHLNAGRGLITAKQEIIELVQLNLEAGKKAKDATAYSAAREYLKIGMEMGSNLWSERYELALDLHKQTAEAEYLNGNFKESEALIKLAEEFTNSPIEKADLYKLPIVQYTLMGEYGKAIKAGRMALSLLGVNLPEEDLPAAVAAELAEAKSNLGSREIASSIDAEEMTAVDKKVAVKILSEMIAPTSLGNVNLYGLVVAKMVNIGLKYGNVPELAFGYSCFGLVLALATGDYRSGYEFGLLSLKLSDKFNNKVYKCKSSFIFSVGLNHWVKHLKLADRILDEGYQASLDSGEFQFGSYLLFCKLLHSFYQDKNLEQFFSTASNYLQFSQKAKNQLAIDVTLGFEIIVSNLCGLTENKLIFASNRFNENEYLEKARSHNSISAICIYTILKCQVLYLYGEYNESLLCCLEVQKTIATMMGNFLTAQHNFYYSLNLISLYPEVSEEMQKEYWEQLSINQKQMKIWADNCAENFLNMYLLVEAEINRISGNYLEAIDLYDRAIELAKENEFLPNQALANELAAKFWLSQRKDKYAKVHFAEAYYGYQRWGAKWKAKDLLEKYPHAIAVITRNSQLPNTLNNTTYTSTGNHSSSLDLNTVMKASQAISGEIVLDKLLDNLMKILIENAGAEKGFLILTKNDKIVIEATSAGQSEGVLVRQSLSIYDREDLPITIINYVERTRSDVVLSDADRENKFTADPYIAKQKIKSVLCTPIIHQGQTIAILYLENNLTVGAFTSERLKVLRLLSAQAAISLENALLYASVEQKVTERTHQLNAKNEHLQQALTELQRTQTQLIQSEKMSSLGQMVAGIAHEINNPINFISGNISFANEYVQNLIELISLYRQAYPQPTSEIEAINKNIDLEFLVADLRKVFDSMRVGAKRIQNIVLGLRNFSRLDEAEMKPVDIHEGIDSTLLILQHRLREESENKEIKVIKEYGNLPKVACYSSQLNQVFMNILTNAIDAIEEAFRLNRLCRKKDIGKIKINTETTNFNTVKILIADNGSGMTEEVQKKIFDPFFTTKPVGSGTGLGLSIGYQIVVEKHGGNLSCISAPGKGTELTIEIPIAPNN